MEAAAKSRFIGDRFFLEERTITHFNNQTSAHTKKKKKL